MSAFVDLLFGAVGAAIAWAVYVKTESPLWVLLLLAGYTLVFLWFRNRNADRRG